MRPIRFASACGLSLTAVVALGVAAPAAPAAGTISRAAFAKRANALCAKATAEGEHLPQPTTPADIPAYLNGTLPIVERLYRDLGRLPLPATHAADVTAALKLGRQESALFRGAVDKVAHGADPVQAMTAIDRQITALSRREDRRWKAVGANRCAS